MFSALNVEEITAEIIKGCQDNISSAEMSRRNFLEQYRFDIDSIDTDTSINNLKKMIQQYQSLASTIEAIDCDINFPQVEETIRRVNESQQDQYYQELDDLKIKSNNKITDRINEETKDLLEDINVLQMQQQTEEEVYQEIIDVSEVVSENAKNLKKEMVLLGYRPSNTPLRTKSLKHARNMLDTAIQILSGNNPESILSRPYSWVDISQKESETYKYIYLGVAIFIVILLVLWRFILGKQAMDIIFGGVLLVAVPVLAFIARKNIGSRDNELLLLSSLYRGVELEDRKSFSESIEAIQEEVEKINSTIREEESALLAKEIAMVEKPEEYSLPDTVRDKIQEEIDSKVQGLRNLKVELLENAKKAVELLKQALEDIDALKDIGYDWDCDSTVMKRRFIVGGAYNEEGALLEASYYNYSGRNIIIEYNRMVGIIEPEIAILKMLTLNFISGVMPNNIEVRYWDGAEGALKMGEFFERPNLPFIREENLPIEEIVVETQKRIPRLSNQTIEDYNTEAMAIEKVSLKYKVYILLDSEEAKLTENVQLKNILNVSAKYGIIIVLLTKQVGQLDISFVDVLRAYPMVQNGHIPKQLDFNYIDKWAHDTGEVIKDYKPAAISYKNKYSLKEWKGWSGDWFKADSTTGVNIRVGFQDGDPTKRYSLKLSDGLVHLLMAGTSGAGKSAAITVIINSLITEYSPNELELIYTDLKITEAAAYKGDKMIPHASVVAGTMDADYILSVFQYLIQTLESRQALTGNLGYKDLQTYNKACMKEGRPEDKMCRVIFLIDEFAQLFTDAFKNIRKEMLESIFKVATLGRAFGVHLFLTSQEISGKLDKETLNQFSARICLRVLDAGVSNMMIGTDQAAMIKEKLGYCYSNESGGVFIKDGPPNILWRIPFADEPERWEILAEVQRKVNEEGFLNRNARFFDDAEYWHMDCLTEEIEQNAALYKEESDRPFILGERCIYTKDVKKAFFYFTEGAKKENLMILAREMYDISSIGETLLRQSYLHTNRVAVLSFNRFTFDVTDMINLLPEGPIRNNALDTNNALENFVSLYKNVLKKQMDEKRGEQFYLYLFYPEQEGELTSGTKPGAKAMLDLLERGSQFGINLIFLMGSFSTEWTQVKKLCNHRICGFAPNEDVRAFFPDNEKATSFKVQGKILPKAVYYNGTDYETFKIYRPDITNDKYKR